MGMAMADTIKHNRTLQHFYLDALKKQLDAGEECVAYTHERLRASCEVVTQRRRKIMLSSPWEVVKREMVWYVVTWRRHFWKVGDAVTTIWMQWLYRGRGQHQMCQHQHHGSHFRAPCAA